ncbi:MAG: ester cyclase [Acidobacteriales bacterium]|nr:ester cyclase [Terriglobales bacterium]
MKLRYFAAASVLLVAITCPAFAQSDAPEHATATTANDTPESRKALFRRLVEAYAKADLPALDQLIAPNYVGHPSTGDRDLEGLRQSILYFHKLFIYAPDSFDINDQLVDGEKVVTRMTAHVKSRATGEPITMIGINIARIVNGKLVEEWNTWEQLHPAPSN